MHLCVQSSLKITFNGPLLSICVCAHTCVRACVCVCARMLCDEGLINMSIMFMWVFGEERECICECDWWGKGMHLCVCSIRKVSLISPSCLHEFLVGKGMHFCVSTMMKVILIYPSCSCECLVRKRDAFVCVCHVSVW